MRFSKKSCNKPKGNIVIGVPRGISIVKSFQMDYSQEYNRVKGQYEEFLNEIIRSIEKLLKDNKIPIAFNVTGRLKSYDSILLKIAARRVRLNDSVTELNDLVGVRVVLLFPNYKEEVLRIFGEAFDIINCRDLKRDKLFGYSSIHLLVSIKSEWALTPTWSNHLGKKIEVQIRTLSEHIHAETSHALFYKREESIPEVHNRELSKLSALLEIVDDKLNEIKVTIDSHFQSIMRAPYEEILGEDLNAATFKRVMIEYSKGLYAYEDQQNHILSSRVEREFNILKVSRLDELIRGRVNLIGINEEQYVEQVLTILNEQLEAQKDISSDNDLG